MKKGVSDKKPNMKIDAWATVIHTSEENVIGWGDWAERPRIESQKAGFI